MSMAWILLFFSAGGRESGEWRVKSEEMRRGRVCGGR